MSLTLLSVLTLMIIALTSLALPFSSSSDSPNPRADAWALSFAEGTVLWAYSLFLWNFLGAGISRLGVLIAMVVVMSFAFWRHRSAIHSALRRRWSGPLPISFSWPEALGWALIFWAMGVAWMQTVSLPLYHFDAVAHFGFFGKVLYVEGTYRVPSLYDNRYFHSAPEYPYLIPYLEALLYRILGSVQDGLVKYLFFSYWLAFIATVYAGIRWRATRLTAVLGTAILATLPLFSADNETQAVSGGVDVAFAVYWTWLMLSAVRYRDTADRQWLWRMVVFSIGCSFTKPNGGVIGLIPWVFCLRSMGFQRREAWRGAAVWMAAMVPWFWTSYGLHTGGYKEPIHWGFRTIVRAIHQIPGVTAAIGQELGRAACWGLFWWVAGAAVVAALWRHRLDRRALFLLSALGVQFLIYVGAYLIFPEPAVWWVRATFPRWLIHFVPLMAIALSWTFASDMDHQKIDPARASP